MISRGKEINIYVQIRFPANIYLFKVNNRNTRNRCVICSKLITYFAPFSSVSIVDFEQVNVSRVNVKSKILKIKLKLNNSRKLIIIKAIPCCW